MAEWKEFISPRVNRNDTVRILANGTILIGADILKKIGNPRRVIYLYDEERKVIGIRPARDDEDGSYVVGHKGKVEARLFFKWIGMEHKYRRVTPLIEDNIIVIGVGGGTNEVNENE